MISLGIIASIAYVAIQGKKEIGLRFNTANSLFLCIFLAAFVGGKVFLFFEDPSSYMDEPMKILAGGGFVFYGSFLFAIPAIYCFFKNHKLPPYQMLDIMAIATCIVHIFGRIGCFMAGCCYGKPTSSFLGVTFTDPGSLADPKNTPLHPTQLYEASFIFLLMLFILYLRDKQSFHGQLFLTYMFLYGMGRFVLEYFRGEHSRGFIIEGILSDSQLVALLIIPVVLMIYFRWSRNNKLVLS